MSYDFSWAKGPNTLYELLQVQPNASKEVIKSAYRCLQKKYHPDKGGKNSLSGKLNNAKAALLDDNVREEYNEYLRNEQDGIIGNYKVIKQISEGGFGRTYKAEHLLLEELACLKQNINVTPEDAEIMTQEAKLLWKIHHHSLPTLRDFFKTDDGSRVFAMTYVEGPTIDKIIENHGGIDPEHVCWMAQRLLNALHYLHFNGVIHCDVKPNNIIIKPEEHNAVLVDYGFSTIKPGKFTAPVGYTEAFAAPELINGKPPIPETDIYSLGKTMIYALGGNPIKGTYPKGTPKQLKQFFDQMILHNPLQRANWEQKDLVRELSDLRMEVFGRKASNKQLKV